jgi:hypothetical protein
MEEGVGFGLTSSYSYCVVSGTSRSIVFHFKQQCESAVDIWHRNGSLSYKGFSHGLMPIYPSIACIHRYSKDYMISISLMPFSCQDSLPTQKCAVSIVRTVYQHRSVQSQLLSVVSECRSSLGSH